MAYEPGCDRVSSVTDPVTGTIGYTYRVSGERATMTLPGGGTWTYGYTDVNANGSPGGAGMPYPSNNGHFGDPNNPFNGGPWAPTQGIWIMPKGDPDSLSLLPNKITDDQGRTVFYMLNFAGQMLTADSNRVYTAQGLLFSHLGTASVLDNPHPEQHPYWLTHGWLAQMQTTYYTQNASQQPIQRIVSQNAYTYDTLGQRQTNAVSVQLTNPDGSGQVDANNNPILSTRTEAYGYDALNRLKSVDYGDGETQAYSFDAMGNRAQKSDTISGTTTTTTSTCDAANRLTGTTGAGASTYTSDADGNTLTGGGRTNTWDSQNRLVSCTYNGTTSTFTYGADGLRRSATVSGVTTYYVYDGQTLIREMMKNTQTGVLYNTATYLTGPRGPECRIDETQQTEGYYNPADASPRPVHSRGVTKWYIYDGLGSVVGETDFNGNLTSSPKYDVYGLVRSNPGTASSKMGFVGGLGHLSEANTGLIYMRARYYDPTQGRFISQDPSGDGVNWYTYCSNNPTNSYDGDGQKPMSVAEHDADMTWYALGLAATALSVYAAAASWKLAGNLLGPYGALACGSVALGAAMVAFTCFVEALGGIEGPKRDITLGLGALIGAAMGGGMAAAITEMIEGASLLGKFAGNMGTIAAGAVVGNALADLAAVAIDT